jgi:hypothetical protein
MAILPVLDRKQIWRGLMRYWSREREGLGLTKEDLQAAIDGVDAWVDANATSMNQAIPQPARNNLTTVQKSLLLVAVVLRRFNVTLLKAVFGEVD